MTDQSEPAMTAMHIRLPGTLFEELLAFAKRRGYKNASEAAREAIRQFIDREPK